MALDGSYLITVTNSSLCTTMKFLRGNEREREKSERGSLKGLATVTINCIAMTTSLRMFSAHRATLQISLNQFAVHIHIICKQMSEAYLPDKNNTDIEVQDWFYTQRSFIFYKY